MADVKQSGWSSGNEVAAMRASLERTLAFAEWANQLPPPLEPQTAAMTVNQMLNKMAGELARIAACYDLKKALEDLEDLLTAASTNDALVHQQYEEAKKRIQDAMTRLGCGRM